jgi:arylsulfatase A-like enzyme
MNKYLLVSITLLSLAIWSCRKESEPLNILMIAIDDMNNWVGVMENKAKTPHIDALARSGVLFSNAYCVVPACNPSRTALLSGKRPETTGQYTNAGNFRDKPGGKDIITLPQYFRQYGYEAVAAGKIFHAPRYGGEEPNPRSDPVSWNDQRIGNVGTPQADLYLDEDGRAAWLEGDWKQFVQNGRFLPSMGYITRMGRWGPIPQPKKECGDWQSAEFCADYLLQDHEKPFFLACGIFRPHSPQLVPQEYFDMYPPGSFKMPEVPEDDMDDIPEIARTNWSTPFTKLVREKGQWELAVQGYLASMTFADDCIGHVLEALEKSAYRENTLVVLWTDHGWQLCHKDRWEKFTLWRQSTNAPLMFRYPGMKTTGQVCKEVVSFLDLYPTLLDLAGLPRKEDLEGETLRPWLEDPGRDKESPAIITYPGGNHSVVWKNWNYIHYEDGSEELYDHSTDVREYHNLAGREEHQALIDKLKEMLPQ